MKITAITNLLLLTSLTLFTACSNKADSIKQSSVYSIMGVEHTQVANTSLDDIPLARTYPVFTQRSPMIVMQEPTINQQPQNIDNYNNYASYQPTIQRIQQENNVHLNNQIEWDAKKLLGLKYVWGATGPRTYDCSGFTQKIFRDAGIKIPRVSRDQAKVGQYISYENLRKGDMVFFDTHKPRTGKVTHVGIYLDNGNFIHASSGAKKIVIFNFNQKQFYKKRFLWGRRIVNNTHMASL